ncbi:MAG: drug/metabolite exporter YedA [Candidatus Promineifilaceae bacterium]
MKIGSLSSLTKHRSKATWVALAFASIYIIWGSTYLAIRIAIETMPPFLMAGFRFVIAGALLYVWAMARGEPRPSRIHLRPIIIIGGLLLLGGNGGVTWAEQTIPSGTAALLVATVPLWMVLLDWLRPGGSRPANRVFLGLGLGLIGVVLLIGPQEIAGGDRSTLVGSVVVILAALSWATGSIYSRSVQLPESPLVSTALEMLAGGALLFLAGTLAGEWGELDPSQISTRSLLSLAYLIFFGAIIAFTAYIWLLKVSTPARVSTYAYVNPVVAVFLGWAILDEALTSQTLIAAAVIVSAVVMITVYRSD